MWVLAAFSSLWLWDWRLLVDYWPRLLSASSGCPQLLDTRASQLDLLLLQCQQRRELPWNNGITILCNHMHIMLSLCHILYGKKKITRPDCTSRTGNHSRAWTQKGRNGIHPKRLSAVCDVQWLGRGGGDGEYKRVKRTQPVGLPENISDITWSPSVFLFLHVILKKCI